MILAKGISYQTKGVIVEDSVLPSTRGQKSLVFMLLANQIR
jgi:hypothetical protein